MGADPIPDSVKWTVTDYEFPPECCRCNSKMGDSSLQVVGQLGRRGTSYITKKFQVPICGDCLEEIKKATKARERRLVRPAVRVLIASIGIIIVFPRIVFPIIDKHPSLGFVGGFFIFASFIGIIISLAIIISTKSSTEEKELRKTVAFGPGGFIFANKDYQARVKSSIATYVPRGLVS